MAHHATEARCHFSKSATSLSRVQIGDDRLVEDKARLAGDGYVFIGKVVYLPNTRNDDCERSAMHVTRYSFEQTTHADRDKGLLRLCCYGRRARRDGNQHRIT